MVLIFEIANKKMTLRCGSRINGDWFPKRTPKVRASRGVRFWIFGDFNSLKSPFLGFWVIQTGYWPFPFYLDEALQIGGLFHQGQFPCHSGYGARRVLSISSMTWCSASMFSVASRLTHFSYTRMWWLVRWQIFWGTRRCWDTAHGRSPLRIRND